MNNMAIVLNHQRRFTEAEKLHRETLDIQRRILGPEHPDTLMSMNNVADVLDHEAATPRQRSCFARHCIFNFVSWGRSIRTRQSPHITSLACWAVKVTVMRRSHSYERLLTTGCPPMPISPSKRIPISSRSMATGVSPLSWPTPKSAPPRP